MITFEVGISKLHLMGDRFGAGSGHWAVRPGSQPSGDESLRRKTASRRHYGVPKPNTPERRYLYGKRQIFVDAFQVILIACTRPT